MVSKTVIMACRCAKRVSQYRTPCKLSLPQARARWFNTVSQQCAAGQTLGHVLQERRRAVLAVLTWSRFQVRARMPSCGNRVLPWFSVYSTLAFHLFAARC